MNAGRRRHEPIKTDRHGRAVTRNIYYQVRCRFGLSAEEYDALIDSRAVCDICGEKFVGREPFIDHCHATGKVRGLLCYHCNTALGQFGDRLAVVRNAVAYLERSGDC